MILIVVPTGEKEHRDAGHHSPSGKYTEAQAVTFSVALEDVAGCTTSTPTNKRAARGNLRSSGAGTCRLVPQQQKFRCFSGEKLPGGESRQFSLSQIRRQG